MEENLFSCDEKTSKSETASSSLLHENDESIPSNIDVNPVYNHYLYDDFEPSKHLYICCDCNSVLKTQPDLEEHRRTIHEGVVYPCYICEYQAENKRKLLSHAQEVHGSTKYSCDECEYKTSRRHNIYNHKKTVHKGIRYSCSQCDIVYKAKQGLEQHQQIVHEGVVYQCKKCLYRSWQCWHRP